MQIRLGAMEYNLYELVIPFYVIIVSVTDSYV